MFLFIVLSQLQNCSTFLQTKLKCTPQLAKVTLSETCRHPCTQLCFPVDQLEVEAVLRAVLWQQLLLSLTTVFWPLWQFHPSTLESPASSPDLWASTASKYKCYRECSLETVYMEIEPWSASPSGNAYIEYYRHSVWTLSFIFNTLLPGGDSSVLSAVIANWFCSLFLLVARHKSKCLSRP